MSSSSVVSAYLVTAYYGSGEPPFDTAWPPTWSAETKVFVSIVPFCSTQPKRVPVNPLKLVPGFQALAEPEISGVIISVENSPVLMCNQAT